MQGFTLKLSRQLLLSISLLATPIAMQQVSAAPAALSIQNVLQQERAWAGLKTKTIQVEDVLWSYSEGGDVNKPTVLLVHGLGGTRDNWNRVARYLTPYYHVVIPDLPASGDTKIPDGYDLSIPNMTEKLRRFLEAGKFEQNVHIAGHSMGGAISMLYTAQYPVEVKSLYLVDAAGVFKSANTPYLKDPTQLNSLLVSKPGDFDRLLAIAANMPPFIPHELKVEQEKMMIANAKNTQKMIDAVIAMSKIYTPDSYALAAGSIDVPVGIIWGEKDKIINAEAAQELKSLLKNADQPLILKNIGHMPILEAEQLLAQHLMAFLAKQK